MSKALFILSELIDRDIDWIITSGNREYISAGTVLIHENEPIAALYILLEGTLSISVAALGDREINRVTQGEILGEMSFIDGRLPSATVTALEDCFILAIPRSQLTEKMDQDVLFSLRFYRAITKFLSSRLRNTNTITPDAQTMPSGQDTSSPLIDPEATHQLKEQVARFSEVLQRLRDGKSSG